METEAEAAAETVEEIGAATVEAQSDAFAAGVHAGEAAAARDAIDYVGRDEFDALARRVEAIEGTADAAASIAVEAEATADAAADTAAVALAVADGAADEAAADDAGAADDQGGPRAPEPRSAPTESASDDGGSKRGRRGYGAGWLSGNR